MERHEFKITWVFENKINTQTSFFPCTSISEVLHAFKKECIIISVEDLTIKDQYHLL